MSNLTSLAATRRQREIAEMHDFYQRYPEMAPQGHHRGSMSNAEFQVSLEHSLYARATGGTPQLVRDRNGGWVQACWGDRRVVEADDADGGDEYAGYSPSAGEFAFNGDCMAEGHLPV